MAGEKRFRTSFLGFKKSDVNLYIEKILKEFEGKMQEKENEISILRSQFRDMKSKYDEISKRAEDIEEYREKIADVLIKAQEAADLMVEEAKNQAIDEKRKIENMVEKERERLVDIKEELKFLKSEVVSTLKKYEGQLSDILEDEAG